MCRASLFRRSLFVLCSYFIPTFTVLIRCWKQMFSITTGFQVSCIFTLNIWSKHWLGGQVAYTQRLQISAKLFTPSSTAGESERFTDIQVLTRKFFQYGFFLSQLGWGLPCWGGSAVLLVMVGIIQTQNTETSHCASQSFSVKGCCSWCWLMKTSCSAQQVWQRTHELFFHFDLTSVFQMFYTHWFWITLAGLVCVRQSLKTLEPVDELKKGPFMLQVRVLDYQQVEAGVEVNICLSATSRTGSQVWESVLTLLSRNKLHNPSRCVQRHENESERQSRDFFLFFFSAFF